MVGTARCAVPRTPWVETARCAVRTPQRGVPTAMKLPTRQRLPHDVPLWVDPSKADYFITVCCKQRGKNQLAHRALAKAILETVKHRNAQGIWVRTSHDADARSRAFITLISRDAKTHTNSCE